MSAMKKSSASSAPDAGREAGPSVDRGVPGLIPADMIWNRTAGRLRRLGPERAKQRPDPTQESAFRMGRLTGTSGRGIRTQMSLRILLIESEADRARSLAATLAEAGFLHVDHAAAGVDLVETVQRLAPDLVVIDMPLPDRDALEGVRALSASAPKPIVIFADQNDLGFVEEAIAAGVCSYNLSGVSKQEMKTIVASAVALFRRYTKVESQFAEAQARLEERSVVERAKAKLMSKRKMTEPQAYRWLRSTAMKESRRIADIADELIRAEEPIRDASEGRNTPE
jgi:response regulator NasT